MRFVIQRVTESSVTIDEKVKSSIGKGFLVLIGVSEEDTAKDDNTLKAITDKMIKKTEKMRIFSDENGKTNLSLDDVDGSVLLVSQFTLFADCKKGNRPSFTRAGEPKKSEEVYEYIVEQFRQDLGESRVGTGEFGADMKISLVNDGPFTVVLDSDEIGAV